MAEVINGGFKQFFGNSAGDRAHESLAALRAIGAVLSAELLEKALTIFPGGVAQVNQHDRIDLMDAFVERTPEFLERLSQVFYTKMFPPASPFEEDLFALRLSFMREHRDEPVEARAQEKGTREWFKYNN